MKTKEATQPAKNLERARVPGINVLVSCGPEHTRTSKDFCFVPEGELVKFGNACCNSKTCGCDRSMVGIFCLKATTVFRVEARAMTIPQLAQTLENSNRTAGWPDMEKEYFLREAEQIVELANAFGVGRVLEIKGSRMRTRKGASHVC